MINKLYTKKELELFGKDKVNHINDFIEQSGYDLNKIKKHCITLTALYNKAEKYFLKQRNIDRQSLSKIENSIDYLKDNGYIELERTDKYILFNLSNSNSVKIEGIRMHNCVGGYNNYDKLYSLKEIIDNNFVKDYATIEDNKQFKGVCNANITISEDIANIKKLEEIINLEELDYKITLYDFELIKKQLGEIKSQYFIFKDRVVFNDMFIY